MGEKRNMTSYFRFLQYAKITHISLLKNILKKCTTLYFLIITLLKLYFKYFWIHELQHWVARFFLVLKNLKAFWILKENQSLYFWMIKTANKGSTRRKLWLFWHGTIWSCIAIYKNFLDMFVFSLILKHI